MIDYLDGNPWLMVFICAIFQAGFFIYTLAMLYKLKIFFPNVSWFTKKGEDDLTLIGAPIGSDDAEKLVDEINGYIQKNNGVVEFGMIKDKTDRKIDSLYEFATSKISFPTYIGLMGTFLGVYIGLKAFSHGLGVVGGGITDEMVKNLISGVIISMLTSLIGLGLMTISNWIAGEIMKNVDAKRDVFYRFIQSDVLPSLETSVSSSLQKLQKTVEDFEPSFRAVIYEFKKSFQQCTDMFKGSFTDNVSILTDAVEKMGRNMTLINDNIQKQDQLLATLSQRKMVQTLDKFVQAASSFDSVTLSIQKLEEAKERILASADELAQRQESYNKSLEIPTKMLASINSVLDRVSSFENSINALGVNIAQTQLLGNTQINLIEEQLAALKKKNKLVVDYQDTEVDELGKIYELQSKAVEDLSKAFQRSIEQNKTDIEDAMNQFQNDFRRIVRLCRDGVEEKLKEFLDALDKALDVEDANRKLSNLDRLVALERDLSELKAVVSDKSQLTDMSSVIRTGLEKQLPALGDRLADLKEIVSDNRQLSDIAKEIRTGNEILDQIGKRPAAIQRGTSSKESSSSKSKRRRRSIWPFGRKNK